MGKQSVCLETFIRNTRRKYAGVTGAFLKRAASHISMNVTFSSRYIVYPINFYNRDRVGDRIISTKYYTGDSSAQQEVFVKELYQSHTKREFISVRRKGEGMWFTCA